MKLQEQWRCIGGCGACCRLDPAQRGEALEVLNDQQRQTYLTMVGPDGWCIHFDTGSRRCRIYEQRPDFCRVDNLVGLFSTGGDDSSEPGVDSSNVKADRGGTTSPAQVGEPAPAAPGRGRPGLSLGDGDPADALAIACCRQQIRSEWGGRGKVMRRFNRAIRHTLRPRR